MTPEEIAEQKVMALLDKVLAPIFVFKYVRNNIKSIAKEIIAISKVYVEEKLKENGHQ